MQSVSYVGKNSNGRGKSKELEQCQYNVQFTIQSFTCKKSRVFLVVEATKISESNSLFIIIYCTANMT